MTGIICGSIDRNILSTKNRFHIYINNNNNNNSNNEKSRIVSGVVI